MNRVIFSIKYEVKENQREEYLIAVKELKSLITSEGLIEYTVFENLKKKNNFEEIYIFENQEAFDDFDDVPNERVSILMNKITSLLVDKTSKYSTIKEVI